MGKPCEPRVGTPRSRGRRTLAPEVVRTGQTLGYPPLPWQRQVLAVALEQARGRPAFKDVIVSVPRRSGKSYLALTLIVWRMLAAPNMRALYAPQDRLSARDMLLVDWWPLLADGPLGDRFRLSRGFGIESLQADNGSLLQLVSSQKTSAHGKTADLLIIDEGWAHDARIEQVRPTLATRRHGQIWVMSTAGDETSTWWRSKLASGRAAAEMGVTSGLACFDWGADRDANPADERAWWQAMPALGRLVDPSTIRGELQAMPVREFVRAYLNVDPTERGDDGWRIISRSAWEASRL
jgi:hypothetical protein